MKFRSINSYVVLFLSTFLLMTFQNCGQVEFEKVEQQDGLVTKLDNTVEDIPFEPDGNEPEAPQEPDGDNEAENNDEGNQNNNPSSTSGLTAYFCILNGPGQSRHVGFRSELFDDGNTPLGVCMSERACTHFISKAFDIKFPKRKGACQNNPHVVHMDDEEIAEEVERLLNQ